LKPMQMKVPYIILAVVLVVVAVIITFSKLPKIKEGEHFEGDTEKVIDRFQST